MLLFSGELHYYRLARGEWADRIEKAKQLGCNVVASYIPWLIHEPRDGEFDLTGSLRPENDLGAFIDLVASYGMYFIARPGPFIMAEMKNEGLPYWVYTKHPEAVPVSWDGEPARSRTLDTIEPGYLSSCRRWYSQVMPILAGRLEPQGGPVIAVQLDNEIGMLSWVHNQPELNEHALCDFAKWLGTKYDANTVRRRYPFDMNDPAERARSLRTPSDEYALRFARDLGDWNRDRIARYVAKLREFAEQSGVRDVPFIINIHGSGGGRGLTFPVGIHHLMQAYTQAEGYLAGSDHYLGELTRENAPDLYLINAFMAAVGEEQPLSSLEFEVGTGDYGETGAVRQSGASADLKVRLSVAQGNRLLNYYVLAGGRNPMLLDPVGDGNDRVAFTGERHGFAAPISPEGDLDPTWHALKRTTESMAKDAEHLADMDPEHDDVAFGFVPDYYKTDYKRPGLWEQMTAQLEYARDPMTKLARAMLFAGFRFPAVNLQAGPLQRGVLAVSLSRYLDRADQRRLADYVKAGGRLLIVGEMPTMDMEGARCLVLAEALGAMPTGFMEASSSYHLSVRGTGLLEGEPEVRLWRAQSFDVGEAEPIARVIGTGAVTAFRTDRAVVFTGNYPCHVRVYEKLFAALGSEPAIRHDHPLHGVILATSARGSERFLHALNLDHEPKTLRILERGQPLLAEEPLQLAPREGKLVQLR